MIGMQFAHYKIIKGLEKQPLYNLFEAIHQGTGASVVLQAVHPKLIQKKPEVIALLQDEVGELAQIENDFLIKPLNFIQDKNHYFVVYPLEEGMSLKKMLGDQPKPLPLDGILRMFDVLLRGLGMVHTCGHLMWGMTLDSVFVDAEGDAKLRGLGKVLFDYQEQLLGKEKMVEQASFFPPEVFIKKENNSVQSNIYSMGCMMYQLATGEMPFKGDTFFRLEMTHTEGNPFPPQQLKSDLPSDFCEMVLKAIHRNPAKRFQSVLEFHAELVKVRKKRNSDLFDPSFTSGFGDLEKKPQVDGDLENSMAGGAFHIEDLEGESGFDLGFGLEDPQDGDPLGLSSDSLDVPSPLAQTVHDPAFDTKDLQRPSTVTPKESHQPFQQQLENLPLEKDANPFDFSFQEEPIRSDHESGFSFGPDEDSSFSEAPTLEVADLADHDNQFDFNLGDSASNVGLSEPQKVPEEFALEGNQTPPSLSFTTEDGAFEFQAASLESSPSEPELAIPLDDPLEMPMPDEDDDGQVMPEIRRSPNELRHSLDQADHKLSPVLGKRVVVKKQNKLIPLALAIGSVAVLAVSFFLFQHFKEKKAFEAYRDQINSLLRQADYVQAKEVIQEAMRGSFSGPFQAELGQLNAKADLELKHINDEINHYLEQARTHEMQGNRLKNGVNDAFGQYVGILRMDSRHEESQAQLERIKTLELQEMDRQGRATLADQIVHLGKLRIMAGHFKKDEALRQRYQDLLLSLQQGRGKELEEQINKLFAQRKYVNIPPLVDELQSIDPSSTFLKEASEKLIKALLAEGDKLVEVQNYEKAESLFLTAMNLDPKNTSIQQKVENVKANAETARIENAVNLLEEAKNNGQLKLQLIHAQALQEIDPGNALARSTLSEVNEKLRSMRAEADRLRHLGRFREAGKEYKAIYDIQATEELKTLYQKYQSWTPPQGMAFIPGGFFQMGSHYEQGAAPMHGVELSPFFVDQREVTNGEFYQFVQNQPEWQPGRQDPARFTEKYLLHWQEGRPVPGTEHEPVRYISWFAAKAYSIWAGKRLLTEAEWEKAAAGGTSDQNYWWGNSPSAMNAVYRKYPQKRPAPVGSFPANEYGLHEILGNVSEWVEDSYDSDFYRTSRDSKDPVQSKGREKVHRGGSFIDQGRHITRYHRFHEDPTACLPNVGLRLAKDAQLR